ncbi:MAG TPA: serine hydrolase domain-containing protein [Candidatus Tumulicola sp.]|nr:serine hydrolase domain-containing protein [Candidatus Tumulicola sp.]
MRLYVVALLALMLLAAPARAGEPDAALRASLQRDIDAHLAARSKSEHISAISVSISLHGGSQFINLAAGTTTYGGSTPITPQTLWQIGSVTKSFTAAAILQLEAQGKLSIDQIVGDWLPQYPAWKNVTIRRLLNMTSGIPSYDRVPAMLEAYVKNRKRTFTTAELLDYAYPGKPHAPPPTTGFDYSNTNYLLCQLIIERASHNGYASEIDRRFLHSSVGLTSTYYAQTQYPASVLDRMLSGYLFSDEGAMAPLAPLLGADVRDDTVSWMQGAGGMVSTPEDVARWARALYAGPMLAPKQRAELQTFVSMKTGEPIADTSVSEPSGFGLGVWQLREPTAGTVRYYEGETNGYRMMYLYFPQQDAVIALGANSAVPLKQDRLGTLAVTLYVTLHKAGRL